MSRDANVIADRDIHRVPWAAVVLALASMWLSPSLAGATAWDIREVGRLDAWGVATPQIVVDRAGAAHIVVRDDATQSGCGLSYYFRSVYFSNSTGNFVQEPVVGLDPFSAGSLALHPAGYALLAVSDPCAPTDALLASREATVWQTVPVPLGSRSFVVDASATLHGVGWRYCREAGCPPCTRDDVWQIAHYSGSAEGATGTDTTIMNLCQVPRPDHLLIATGPDGSPHVVISDHRNLTLVHAQRAGEAWRTSNVATVSERTLSRDGVISSSFREWPVVVDLAVDSVGTPHVAYFSASRRKPKNEDLDPVGRSYVASQRDGAWSKKPLGKGAFPTVAIGPDDTVHVVYTARLRKRGRLIHAWLEGTRWRHERIANVPPYTLSALFIDELGLHVAYGSSLEPRSVEIRYAHRAQSAE